MRITLETEDGVEISAARCDAKTGRSLGGVVLLHEIFGLTPYIEGVADYWSGEGFDVIAPGLFDRQGREIVVDYNDPKAGLAHADRADPRELLNDIRTSCRHLMTSNRSVAVVGFCWGGGLAYKAACELEIDAAVVIYGTRLMQYADQTPNCPVQFNFGKFDKHGGEEVREAMRRSAPDASFQVYAADHGFDRKSDDAENRAVRDALRANVRAFLKRALVE